MTRIEGPVRTVNTLYGPLRMPWSMTSGHIVGDRLVPSPIEVDFPGADGQPRLTMTIEVIDGVPRCTELAFTGGKGGREVRQRDLRAVELDSWIEAFVSVCSPEITRLDEDGMETVDRANEESLRLGMNAIRNVRKGSRRPLTGDRMQRVADVYNAHEKGGIEAVGIAFAVSRSTAIRYIKAAREAGLIEKRDEQ